MAKKIGSTHRAKNDDAGKKSEKTYYKLNLAELPDDLFHKSVPVSKWLDLATSVKGAFPANSLNKVPQIDLQVEMERTFGIALWMISNVLPFVMPMLGFAAVVSDIGYTCLKCFLIYFGTLYSIHRFYFLPIFVKRYNRKEYLSDTDIADNQYL